MKKYLILFLCSFLVLQLDAQKIPGKVIAYSNPETNLYLGSPGITITPNGNYLVSHDFFGKIEGKSRNGAIYRSTNEGKTWTKTVDLNGHFWGNLFVHKNEIYLLGCDGQYGNLVIRKSTDDGLSWTHPKDEKSGLLRNDFEYHTASMPMIIHNGRIFRAIEVRNPPERWGVNFEALIISAPVNSDLLHAESWTTSNHIHYDPNWPTGNAWLEGNIVKTPANTLVNILRVNEVQNGGYAAIIDVSDDGKEISFDPEKGFIHFPGGCKKFVIRYDEESKRYWTLTNFKRDIGYKPERTRNCLSLASSADLLNWTVHEQILYNPDFIDHGFQYADWQVDGNDIVAVIRTAFDDGKVKPHNCHDSNYILFKRIKKFRKMSEHKIAEFHN